MADDKWHSVFDYLKNEASFQGTAATATGVAAAWILKTVLLPSKDAVPLAHPTAARLAAILLAGASFLFLVEQGRLSKVYGEIARHLAGGGGLPDSWQHTLVRDDRSVRVIQEWLPYYAARGLVLVAIVFVVWMLWP